MKSYDFGQFLFNSSFLDENQLANLIVAALNKKATLAVKAFLLRAVSADDLKNSLKTLQSAESLEEYLRSHDAEVQGKYDEIVTNFLGAEKSARLEKAKGNASISLIQALIDSGTVSFEQLEKLLDDYNKLESSPIEDAFAIRYESLPPAQKPEYSLVLEVVKSFCEFTSESFSTSIVLLPSSDNAASKLFGATVKVTGEQPVVIGIFAEESVFMKFAQSYNHFTESIEDAVDVVSEFLNIYVGHLTIRLVAKLGKEEEPETPRSGEAEDFNAIKMLADCGEFYLYVGTEEYFANGKTPADDLAALDDLSQFGLGDLGDLGIDLDDDSKDPYDF